MIGRGGTSGIAVDNMASPAHQSYKNIRTTEGYFLASRIT